MIIGFRKYHCYSGLIGFLKVVDRDAQRLAAQPLGHFRYVVTILAVNPKPQFIVLTLSLGQVGCSRVLGVLYLLIFQ
jgi:hypothetical protein